MGYTTFTKQLVEKYIQEYSPKSVLDLGSQNDFSGPNLPAPYISLWYQGKGIHYECVDLNGENNAFVWDLSKLPDAIKGGHEYDFVVDAGTSEHVGDNGKFGWEAIYNCWLNKWNLLKVGGIMISENPLEGNWPEHGFNYYNQSFYTKLSSIADCKLLETGKHAAMGNVTDGWNVYAVLQKTGQKFMTLEEFETLPLKQK